MIFADNNCYQVYNWLNQWQWLLIWNIFSIFVFYHLQFTSSFCLHKFWLQHWFLQFEKHISSPYSSSHVPNEFLNEQFLYSLLKKEMCLFFNFFTYMQYQFVRFISFTAFRTHNSYIYLFHNIFLRLCFKDFCYFLFL